MALQLLTNPVSGEEIAHELIHEVSSHYCITLQNMLAATHHTSELLAAMHDQAYIHSQLSTPTV